MSKVTLYCCQRDCQWGKCKEYSSASFWEYQIFLNWFGKNQNICNKYQNLAELCKYIHSWHIHVAMLVLVFCTFYCWQPQICPKWLCIVAREIVNGENVKNIYLHQFWEYQIFLIYFGKYQYICISFANTKMLSAFILGYQISICINFQNEYINLH